MTLFAGIILGFVEGLTEFIPVSSSGHLIIAHHFLGTNTNDLAVDAILQLATILAVGVYFRKDLWNVFLNFLKLISRKEIDSGEKTLPTALIVGTIPAVILGLLLEKYIGTVFRSTHLVALALIGGSILMYIAEKTYRESQSLSISSGFKIGLYQCLALIPGVSRSGATISGGLLEGLSREQAVRFSFLLSFPIILGSGLKKLLDLVLTGGALTLPLGVSFLVSFVVGLFCIHYLLKYLRNHSLQIFIWYRVILAIILLMLL